MKGKLKLKRGSKMVEPQKEVITKKESNVQAKSQKGSKSRAK